MTKLYDDKEVEVEIDSGDIYITVWCGFTHEVTSVSADQARKIATALIAAAELKEQAK
ncbi:MAG: hypothetical protein NTX28_07815 [Novosphingobium sp.]|nr:hypothetical protein [Novosphingobium sp.]